MKAIMVMYDSLNRLMLEPYGCDWVKTPNFSRLAEKTVTFDQNYVGSMPCMPARRELHTGRYNFMHRSWGPMEPFDDSMPEILKKNGIYSHLVSDHQHYWEDGGCTYHTRYCSWDAVRGQEGDPWQVTSELLKNRDENNLFNRMHSHDAANRSYENCEERMPQARTFRGGLDFLEKCWDCDDWFLQIETFDPHEPFFTQPEYKKLYEHRYDGPMTDWPPYYFVTEGESAVDHMRKEYAALITMCDTYLGKVLDFMDNHDMWKDTMLIVNTDHGYLLGEHGWWSKSIMPIYNEIAHTPLFIWDPRVKAKGERRQALTQTIDLPATILDYFGLPIPQDMQGRSLRPVLESDQKIREYAVFGYHEMHMNITDGRWVYMRAPQDSAPELCNEYTLMPTHMRAMFDPEELRGVTMTEPFRFTKGCPVMKIQAKPGMTDPVNFGTRLYDLEKDPRQEAPLVDAVQEVRLSNALLAVMDDTDCPEEYYLRFGYRKGQTVTEEDILSTRAEEQKEHVPEALSSYRWTKDGSNAYHAMARFVPEAAAVAALQTVPQDRTMDAKCILEVIDRTVPVGQKEMLLYFVHLNSRCD